MFARVFIATLLVAATLAVSTTFDPEAIYGSNVHQVDQLDYLVHANGIGFIRDLRYHEIYLNLRNAIRNGHSVRFDVLKGDHNLIANLAAKHHIQVSGDTLTFEAVAPSGQHLVANPYPEVVEADDASRPEPDDSQEPSLPASERAKTKEQQENEYRNKIFRTPLQFDDQRKQWYYDNNRAQASKMDQYGRLYVENLLDKLKTLHPNTIIQLMTPIRNGNAVRFLLLAGDSADVESLASQCHLKIDGDLITTPHMLAYRGEHHVQADARLEPVNGPEDDGHLVADPAPMSHPESGILDPIPNRLGSRVSQLPNNLITTPAH